MQKRCGRCGHEMNIMLRNVVYRNRVKINNVPVYVCMNEDCAHSQVVDMVKEDLKKLMNELGDNPPRHSVEFEEISEFSNFLVQLDVQKDAVQAKQLIAERINELLDVFLLAQSLGDKKWMEETRQRLTQVMLL